jgi:hypothetical protein
MKKYAKMIIPIDRQEGNKTQMNKIMTRLPPLGGHVGGHWLD